jgi:PPOX class probable F420-dependent enzyme
LDDLGDARWVRHTTYRRDGRPAGAQHPVVREGDVLAVWAGTMSGSARRLRDRSDLLLGPCDRWGQLLGPQMPGRAAFAPSADKKRIARLLRRKYGLMRWFFAYSGHTRSGRASHVVIRVTLT